MVDTRVKASLNPAFAQTSELESPAVALGAQLLSRDQGLTKNVFPFCRLGRDFVDRGDVGFTTTIVHNWKVAAEFAPPRLTCPGRPHFPALSKTPASSRVGR
jgi:hypothetical protein